MKRDMGLIIEILKAIEDRTKEERYLELHIDNQDDNQVQYNIGLAWKAGFIEATDVSADDMVIYLVGNLTWEGHDFLDAARNEVVVDKVKEIAIKQGAEFNKLPFEIVKSLLIETMKSVFFH